MEYITPKDYCQITGLPISYIRNQLRLNNIPNLVVGNRYYFKKVDADEFIYKNVNKEDYNQLINDCIASLKG